MRVDAHKVVATLAMAIPMAAAVAAQPMARGERPAATATALMSATSGLAAPYDPPEIADDARIAEDGTAIDVSDADKGEIRARAATGSGARHKLLVSCGSERYAYDLPGDGSAISVPTNMGEGTYVVSVMREVRDCEYVPVLSAEAEVVLDDPDRPFLEPSVMCPYSPDGACAREAHAVAAGCETRAETVDRMFDRVMVLLSYDYAKADRWRGESGYLPSPDAAISEGQGICIDYASALAAMLRSCGIPAKIATGTVMPLGEHHAWVEAKVSPGTGGEGKWVRLDPTLSDRSPGIASPLDATYEKRHEY